MATWKKVIVSGSSAHLTSITSSVLTNDNLLIAGNVGQIESSGLTYNGTTLALGGANITSTGANSVLTGSFAGTFSGSVIINQQDLTNGTGITSFTYDGNSPATVSVSGASTLSTNAVTKWTGNAFANTTITDNGTTITTTTPLNVGGAITASGDIIPGANNVFALGKSGNKWNSLFVENIIAQGNLTIGDAVTDTINFISRVSSSFVPNNDNAFDLGISGTRWRTLFVNNISASGNISSSAGLIGATLTTSGNATIGGTLNVTGGTTLTGALTASIISASSGITGSLFGTASWAQSASNAVNAQTASNIFPAITNNTDNRVLTATGGGSINGESNLTFDGTNLTVTGNTIITNNLTVQGTASFQQTTNLEVADRFILLASGSNSAGNGGIVVQQATQNVGEVFAWDNPSLRWGITGSFTANQSTYTPDAFMAAVVTAASTTPSPATRYNAVGNIYVSSGDESIWIYS